MKRLLFMLMGLALGAMCLRADDITPAQKGEFLGKVQAAVATKDYGAFLVLYCPKGNFDPAMKEKVDRFTHELFEKICLLPTRDFTIVPPPKNALVTTFSRGGKTYGPNLPIIALLQVGDPTDKQINPGGGIWSLPLGIDNGTVMIVQTVVKD